MCNDASPVDGFRLDLLRPGQLVPLRTGHSRREQLLDVFRDDVTVFGVNLRHRTQLLARLEDFVQFTVGDLKEALVRHEALERVDSAFLAQDAHLVPDGLGPPRDGHVQTVIADHLCVRPAPPLVVRFQQRFALLWNDKVHDCGGAAGHRRLRALVEIVHRDGAAELELEVGVRIDTARDDHQAGRVYRAAAAGHDKVRTRADVSDGSVLDVDVCLLYAIVVHHVTPFDVQAVLRAL